MNKKTQSYRIGRVAGVAISSSQQQQFKARVRTEQGMGQLILK